MSDTKRPETPTERFARAWTEGGSDGPEEGETTEPVPFAVGDTVRLNSGGPLMTVINVDTLLELVFCKWFDIHLHLQEGAFGLNAVTPDEPSRADFMRYRERRE